MNTRKKMVYILLTAIALFFLAEFAYSPFEYVHAVIRLDNGQFVYCSDISYRNGIVIDRDGRGIPFCQISGIKFIGRK